MTSIRALPCLLLSTLLLAPAGCRDDRADGDDTSAIGAFNGLFDGVATGLNFPFDIGIAPDDPSTADLVEGGDIYIANYGTSEVMFVSDPTGQTASGSASPIFAGTSIGLAGAMAISVPHHDRVWAAFEQGGSNNGGGIAVLDGEGTLITSFDGSDHADAFANPGGLCFGGWDAPGATAYFYLVNLGDGTAWRIAVSTLEGDSATFTRIGSGLATGVLGNSGSPGNGITTSSDTPQGGARGCAYTLGSLYVADAQNARVVRFDEASTDDGIDGVSLEDLEAGRVTFPTGVAVNEEGFLIVISYDNAHAFVAVELPRGRFLDNGLHDLSVNAGNYGVALASGTVWFTRANNQNGTLRAITPEQDILPTTAGPFPPQ